MSRETRQEHTKKLEILKSVQGHDSTVAHTFNHTDGHCPKCGCNQLHQHFCLPFQQVLPRVPGCELDGEHVHRICGACRYPWVERPWDQAMLAEEKGELVAESEAAAMLAAIAGDRGGICLGRDYLAKHRGWTIYFARDAEKGTVTVTAEPPKPEGTIIHPTIQPGRPE